MKLSTNAEYLEKQVKTVLEAPERFAGHLILPINTAKTKAMFVHTRPNAAKPKVKYKKENIGYVSYPHSSV
jgi:hypothetical protein